MGGDATVTVDITRLPVRRSRSVIVATVAASPATGGSVVAVVIARCLPADDVTV